MKKYVYQHKNTGQKIYTDNEIDNPKYTLISQVSNTKMGSDEVVTKKRKKNE